MRRRRYWGSGREGWRKAKPSIDRFPAEVLGSWIVTATPQERLVVKSYKILEVVKGRWPLSSTKALAELGIAQDVGPSNNNLNEQFTNKTTCLGRGFALSDVYHGYKVLNETTIRISSWQYILGYDEKLIHLSSSYLKNGGKASLTERS